MTKKIFWLNVRNPILTTSFILYLKLGGMKPSLTKKIYIKTIRVNYINGP